MKIKLYIDGLYPIPNTLCEESIYTLGKIDNDVIKNSVAFKDISQEDILEHVEYTDIDNCDYILYPYKIEPYANIDNLISLSEEYNKKILLFYNDDNELHQKKLIKLWEDYLSPIGFIKKTNEYLLKNN